MNKLKQLIKNYVDKLIIKHSKFLEDYYNDICVGSIALFISTAFIGSVIHAPKFMCITLLVELLLMVGLIHFTDYINKVLDKD